jgi:hypothetical protein
MIDLETETPIPLKQATRHRLLRAKSANGQALNFSTVWRWAMNGSRGVRLETVRIAATLCTTNEAIERFIERLSNPALPTDAPTPSQANRDHRRAEAELENAGI